HSFGMTGLARHLASFASLRETSFYPVKKLARSQTFSRPLARQSVAPLTESPVTAPDEEYRCRKAFSRWCKPAFCGCPPASGRDRGRYIFLIPARSSCHADSRSTTCSCLVPTIRNCDPPRCRG